MYLIRYLHPFSATAASDCFMVHWDAGSIYTGQDILIAVYVETIATGDIEAFGTFGDSVSSLPCVVVSVIVHKTVAQRRARCETRLCHYSLSKRHAHVIRTLADKYNQAAGFSFGDSPDKEGALCLFRAEP